MHGFEYYLRVRRFISIHFVCVYAFQSVFLATIYDDNYVVFIFHVISGFGTGNYLMFTIITIYIFHKIFFHNFS